MTTDPTTATLEKIAAILERQNAALERIADALVLVDAEPMPAAPPDTLKLTLTGEEASALLWVLNKVGGDPAATPRGLIDNIGQI